MEVRDDVSSRHTGSGVVLCLNSNRPVVTSPVAARLISGPSDQKWPVQQDLKHSRHEAFEPMRTAGSQFIKPSLQACPAHMSCGPTVVPIKTLVLRNTIGSSPALPVRVVHGGGRSMRIS